MIYNDKFIWIHLPKCAGTKIEHLFLQHFSHLPEIIQDPITLKQDPLISWHDSIAKREQRDPNFHLGKRDIICSIRKLPQWLESRYNFELHRSNNITPNPEILLTGHFFHSNGSLGHADTVVKRFLPKNILTSARLRFIRTEHFAADFKAVFADYVDVSIIPETKYSQKINTSKNYIPETIRQQLYHPATDLYAHCPYWQQVESQAYT